VNSATWDLEFQKYLIIINCPYHWPSEKPDCIHWLVMHGVNMEYEDVMDECVGIENNIGYPLDVSSGYPSSASSKNPDFHPDENTDKDLHSSIIKLGAVLELSPGMNESDEGRSNAQLNY
jgi:hypothetical protein